LAELAGVGVELVSVPRFRSAVDRFGGRLLERVFSPGELAYAERKRDGALNLAARFAAKCAGRRALAHALEERVALRALEVVRRRSGEPTLALVCGPPESKSLRFALSLTHDPDYALASVWVEWLESSR
jgi:holo-[acyl-carrier protein] synthase